MATDKRKKSDSKSAKRTEPFINPFPLEVRGKSPNRIKSEPRVSDVSVTPLPSSATAPTTVSPQSSGRPSTSSATSSRKNARKSLQYEALGPFKDPINKIETVLVEKGLDKHVSEVLIKCLSDLCQHQKQYYKKMDMKQRWEAYKKKCLNTSFMVKDAMLRSDEEDSTTHTIIDYITKEFIGDDIDVSELKEKPRRKDRSIYREGESLANSLITGIMEDSLRLDLVCDILENLTWDSEIFKLNTLLNGNPLSITMVHIFEQRQLFDLCNIDKDAFLHFIHEVQNHYDEALPYHNAMHATDVVISANHLISCPSLENKLSDFECAVTLIASAVHDVNHLGYSNKYLVTTEHPLSKLYLEDGIMERHHYKTTCEIMSGKKNCDITKRMSEKRRRDFMIMLEALIMGTDMTKHEGHITEMASLQGVRGARDFDLPKQVHKRTKFLGALLHCCDIANPTKAFPIYEGWIDRVKEEFFRQGDEEAKKGLQISPMCDRRTTNFFCMSNRLY